jgi:hypothetical protein
MVVRHSGRNQTPANTPLPERQLLSARSGDRFWGRICVQARSAGTPIYKERPRSPPLHTSVLERGSILRVRKEEVESCEPAPRPRPRQGQRLRASPGTRGVTTELLDGRANPWPGKAPARTERRRGRLPPAARLRPGRRGSSHPPERLRRRAGRRPCAPAVVVAPRSARRS